MLISLALSHEAILRPGACSACSALSQPEALFYNQQPSQTSLAELFSLEPHPGIIKTGVRLENVLKAFKMRKGISSFGFVF